MNNVDISNQRAGGLLSWQWSQYTEAHQDRTNLALHALTAPVFMLGSALVVTAPFSSAPYVALAAGTGAALVALIAQGRGHRGESTTPAAFRSPLDFVLRFVAEQWVTFPRFVLSGGFARAWRSARRERV